MRTVAEGEYTPFPELFDEGLRVMRRKQRFQEKYMELLEAAVFSEEHVSGHTLIQRAKDAAWRYADAQIEEGAK